MNTYRQLSLYLLGILVVGFTSSESGAQSTFTALAITDGISDEEYSDLDEWVPGAGLPSSVIDASSLEDTTGTALADSAFAGIGTGSAYVEHGVIRSLVTGVAPSPMLSNIVLSVAGFTDSITLFAEGQEGMAGNLHLEFSLDGSIDAKAGSFASVSLSLLNRDLPELENLDDPLALNGADVFDNYSEAFYDPAGDTAVTYTPEDPLMVTLDIPVNFGEEVNYGAALFLIMSGEGTLDFSHTIEFTDASVTDLGGQAVSDVGITSSAGIGYGSLTAIPEPGAPILIAIGIIACLGWRRR
jgi:hypothetical protein